jgi:hypothetical protein
MLEKRSQLVLGIFENSFDRWEYRKGIEGMSMGSMAYEMLTVW